MLRLSKVLVVPAADGVGARSGASIFCRRFAAVLILVGLCVMGTGAARGQNVVTPQLLANPGAEAGSIAGWTATGAATVDNGSFGGITPHTGKFDFVGFSGATASLAQTVSAVTGGITPADLDSGKLSADVSFWEQGVGQSTVGDDAEVGLTFLDANGAAISSVNSGEVDNHVGQWGNFAGTFAIPVGTRSITYTMTFFRHIGTTSLNAYVDDNSLTISSSVGLGFNPLQLHFGNVPVGTTSAAQVVTVTNSGMATINIVQIASELGANPNDFVQTNNCPAALTEGVSCTMSVTFKPSAVGIESAGIDFPDDSVPADQYVRVDGTGTGGVLQVNPGSLKTIAGNGTLGYTGDGGQATAAELNQPNGIGFDPSGNLYIADDSAEVVRKVDTTGKITTFAGTGAKGYTGDGGLATAAQLYAPSSVASDKNGNIYIQDTGNYVVRKVDTTGKITTFAGTGVPGHSGDGGPATAARFNNNIGARFDSAGNLFVPQCRGASIRHIDTSGIITTVAGNFTQGYSGDGGPATAAQLQCPSGVAIDAAGNFYIADYSNNVIRIVDTQGIISTFAGSTAGTGGFAGDGGQAAAALLSLPNDVVLDSVGNLYIADSGNNRVRMVNKEGIITTVAGGLNNAGSPGVNTPLGVNVDAAGNVYFTDSGNGKVQEVFPQGTQPFPATQVGTTAAVKTVTLSNIGNVAITINGPDSFTTSGDRADFSLTGGTCLAGVTLAAATGTCTLQISFTPTAAGQRSVTISVADDALNSPQSFTVGGAGTAGTTTVTWPTPANIPYGTALSATQLNAVATGAGGVSVPGVYTYTPAAGTVLAAGAHTLSVRFTSSDPNYSDATGTVPITVTQFTPVLTWATPAPITTTTPLSATQLNAAATDINSAAVPGTYDYTPAAGTLLTVGSHGITVTFTPTDAVDFTSVTTTRTIMVTQSSAATTTTTLGVTAGEGQISQVAAGKVVTLTATVSANQNSISPGQVAFCDALVGNCKDIHLLATAQLVGGDTTSTATYKFVPGIGAHSYRAIFLGTAAAAGSTSSAAALVVTGTYPTATTIAQSGAAGNYTLTATTVGVSPPSVQAGAQKVTVTLGQSAQTYVLTGTGSSTNQGQTYGNYYNTQGSCVTAGATTTCDLTGTFTGSTASFAGGTYDFQTTFTGNISSAITSQTSHPVGSTEPNDFQYSAFAASLNMTLKLNVTNGGSYAIPVAVNGNFDPNFNALNFSYVSPVCGGTSLGSNPCQQDYVGTVVGATYSGVVTGAAAFTLPALPSPGPAGPTGLISFVDTSKANAVLGTGVLAAATPGFTAVASAGSPVATGNRPQGTATGDFNRDGIADLVVTNTTGSTVGILLGNGDGTFKPMVTYASGAGPITVQVADFNGDGNLDLVVANYSDGTVGILLGKGDGTFQAQVTYAAGNLADSVAVMDVNRDGTADLVVSHGNASTTAPNVVSVLLGKGDGTFSPAVTYTTGSAAYETVAEGDFNGDGFVDLAVSNITDGTVGILLGKGDGTFQPRFAYTVGQNPKAVQAGDFNGDGVLDLAVANSATNTVGVLLGNGDGTFKPQVTYRVGTSPYALAVTDVNEDGRADIAVVDQGDNTIVILQGNGDGTFQTGVQLSTGGDPYGLAAADFNRDGATDLAVVNFTDSTATVLLSKPTQTATATATGIAPSGTGTHAVAANYPGDTNFAKSVSQTTNLIVSGTTPVITWATPASIVYGTALSATQLNATAATAAGVAVPGTFTYTPALGTVLTAGQQTLTVAFAPTSTTFSAATGSVVITVTKAVPVITWATPAGIAYGTALSTTQLDATVAAVSGVALPGTLAYTPILGTVLSPGTQTLSVVFTPTDAVDYTTAAGTVQIVVAGLSLTAISPTGALAGAPNTTITLTGTGFVPSSLVLAGTNSLATTYVSPTTLTAVVPRTLLGETGTLAILVNDPLIESNSTAQTFTVVPAAGAVSLTGPTTTPSGSQPSVGLTITNPYPLPVTAQFTLSFASSTTPQVDDGTIQFSNGQRSFSYVVAANATTAPPVQLQAGTDAGTITVAAKLTADGVDVTPGSLAPLVIVVPAVVPVISGTTVTRSGDTLTVVVHGFSNTREVSQAEFEFMAATGDTLATPKLTIPATTIFSNWFVTDPTSVQYGSTFTYTQMFHTSGAASTVGPVKVTLTNSVGASVAGTGP